MAVNSAPQGWPAGYPTPREIAGATALNQGITQPTDYDVVLQQPQDNAFLGGGVPIDPGQGLGGNALGFSIGLSPTIGPISGQTFRTIPVPNLQPCLYGLAIRGSSTAASTAQASNGNLIAGFTFPLSPESLRKEYIAMANVYDVFGVPQQGGVNRVVDSYGNSPPTFLIEGTTGWQFHSTDGYQTTGLQAVSALERFLFQYAQYNAQQQASQQPPYTMEFYDYFRNDFWQVEPVGPQGTRMSSTRPILVYYFFRLVGVLNLATPISSGNDQVSNVLNGSQQPTPGTPGGVIDPNTNATPTTPDTANVDVGPVTIVPSTPPPAMPDSLGSSDLEASSANLKQNYGPVTPIPSPGALMGPGF